MNIFSQPGPEVSSTQAKEVQIKHVEKVNGSDFPKEGWGAPMYLIETSIGTYISSSFRPHQANTADEYVEWSLEIGKTARIFSGWSAAFFEPTGKSYWWLRKQQ